MAPLKDSYAAVLEVAKDSSKLVRSNHQFNQLMQINFLEGAASKPPS